jgi:DNA-binding XRE family transcriptional regulator
MNPMQELENRLRKQFPAAKFDLSRPARDDGVWFLDVLHKGNALVIQWQPGSPFGLSSLEGHGYGEKPAEIRKDLDDAEARVVALLKTGGRTERPLDVTLRDLRAELNLTQEQLARELGVRQAAVSKMERRSSRLLVSTLAEVVRAMGGRLVLQAVFPDGDIRRILLEDEEEMVESSTAAKCE